MHDGRCDGTHALMNVELRDLIAWARACISEIDLNFRCPLRPYSLRLNADIFKRKGCVAQAIAERKQRIDVVEQIPAACRWLVIVIVGKLSDGAGKSDRQLTARIHLAE